MASIRRYPVPAESYEPNRPLNDLGRDQLKHFIQVARQLPASFQWDGVLPSAEDGPACTRFITAVTEHIMSMRKASLTLVSSKVSSKVSGRPRKTPMQLGGRVDIAAKAARPKSSKPRRQKP